MRTLEDDPYIVTKAYMFTTFDIIFCVPALNHLDSSHTHSLKVFNQVGQASYLTVAEKSTLNAGFGGHTRYTAF